VITLGGRENLHIAPLKCEYLKVLNVELTLCGESLHKASTALILVSAECVGCFYTQSPRKCTVSGFIQQQRTSSSIRNQPILETYSYSTVYLYSSRLCVCVCVSVSVSVCVCVCVDSALPVDIWVFRKTCSIRADFVSDNKILYSTTVLPIL